MPLLHRLASIGRWLMHRDALERELDDELQAFVEMSAAAKVRDGVAPEAARRLAVLELHGIEQAKERVRTGRHGGLLDEVGRDVRYAFRILRKRPGFSFVVVFTIALGIGANTAIFTLIDALLLRWLPVRAPQELVQVEFKPADADAPGSTFSYAIVDALAQQHDIFAGVAGFSPTAFTVRSGGAAGQVAGALVTGDYYSTLGLHALAGRLLTAADDRPGAPVVAVLSYGFWVRQFAANAAAIGQPLVLNGVPTTVVGVSPRGFAGTTVGSVADITVAVAMLPQVAPEAAPLLEKGNFWLRALARPRPGVAIPQAEARLASVWPRLSEEAIAPHWPASRRKAMADGVFRLPAGGTGASYLRQMYQKPLFVLMAMVFLVLLIACANVASLLLAQVSARQHEVGIRLAIGASRARIIRQLLIESTLLALIGATFGIGIAWLSSRVLVDLISTGPFPVVFDLTPNWHVLGFTATAAVVTGIVFGVIPALQATATASALKAGMRTASAAPSRLLPSLVSLQVALSLVLLVGASLFVRTLQNLQNFDPGFRSEGVLLADLGSQRTPVLEQLLDEVQRVPGVVSASVSTHTPLSGSRWSEPAVPAGQTIPDRDTAVFVGASPGYFATMAISLRAGRAFGQGDGANRPATAIVNERFAQRYFGTGNPVGRRLAAQVMGETKDLEIVGLAANTSVVDLRQAPPLMVYVPHVQLPSEREMTLEVRGAGALDRVGDGVRQVLQRRFPGATVDLRPLSAQVATTLVRERIMATLAGGFGGLALAVACIGLYGLLAYTVVRQTREIGIRLALGAQRADVIRRVLGSSARLVAVGLALGLPVALATSRWIESMLFGVTPADPATIAIAVLLLAVSAHLAAFLPARRASRVDPLSTLRHE